MQHRASRQAGFTLIELSIVLVIVGLLTGGIIEARTLIRASQLNAAIGEVGRYKQAIADFRDKYQAYPGDMSNAESFWGTASGGCPNGAGTGTQVCNGDGNGHVAETNSGANFAERASQWIELANAGMIDGGYSYSFNDYTHHNGSYEAGVNMPASRLSGGAYQFLYSNPSSVPLSTALYSGVTSYYGHWLLLGGIVSGTGVLLPILTGKEALSLDIKLDDGSPATGTVRGSRNSTVSSYTPACQTTDVSSTALYAITSSSATCMMMFYLFN